MVNGSQRSRDRTRHNFLSLCVAAKPGYAQRGFGVIRTIGTDNLLNGFCILRSVLQNPGNAAGSRRVLPRGPVTGMGAALALPLNANQTQSLQQPMRRLLTRKRPSGAALPLWTNTFQRVPGLPCGDREAVKL